MKTKLFIFSLFPIAFIPWAWSWIVLPISKDLSLETRPFKLRVEIFLARDRKGVEAEIRKQFKSSKVENVHFQFFRAGHPPENIAIGRGIPSEIARLAIQIGIQYNDDVNLLLLQNLLPPTWIGIGTSAFDELAQIPITPEDLKRLMDPSLSDEAFHQLYRELSPGRRSY